MASVWRALDKERVPEEKAGSQRRGLGSLDDLNWTPESGYTEAIPNPYLLLSYKETIYLLFLSYTGLIYMYITCKTKTNILTVKGKEARWK